jgi:hypothetical protein
VIFYCSFDKRYAIYRQISPLVSLANISIESTVHHSTVFTAARATDHEFRNSKMNSVLIDTREICKLMDELERDIQSSDWWYDGEGNGRSLQDVWNSHSTLGDGSDESISDAFSSNRRIVFQYFNLVGGHGKSAVGVKTF